MVVSVYGKHLALATMKPLYLIRTKNRYLSILMLILFMGFMVSSCTIFGEKTPTPTPSASAPTATIVPTATSAFTPTPTLPPLGTPERPVMLAVYAPTDPASALNSGMQLAQKLSELTGFSVSATTYTDYGRLIIGLGSGDAHVAWLPPATYILAHNYGYAEAALVINRFGVYKYGSMFMANRESNLQSYFSELEDKNTTDEFNVLFQFQDKRPCWVEETSLSGYLVPLGYLKKISVSVLPGVITRTHIATLRGLYIGGLCDFGAVYAYYGDPRTSNQVQADLPDIQSKVLPLWRTPAIIPNLNLSFSSRLPLDFRASLVDSFLILAQDSENIPLLNQVAGDSIQGLREINDTFYDDLRDILLAAQVYLPNLIGK